jgi:hypothetical protein
MDRSDDEVISCLYILRGHVPVPTDDVDIWNKWFEETDRRVAKTTLKGGVFVSTVFLGVDHSFGEGSPPILFETMVFDPRRPKFDQALDEYTRRYVTWEEAEAGHKEVVTQVEEVLQSETKTE